MGGAKEHPRQQQQGSRQARTPNAQRCQKGDDKGYPPEPASCARCRNTPSDQGQRPSTDERQQTSFSPEKKCLAPLPGKALLKLAPRPVPFALSA
jgi:hypothetical protein